MVLEGPIPFPEETLTEIGRLTVAATTLEFYLSQLAATVQQGSADSYMARPGAALKMARRSLKSLESPVREEFTAWVENATRLLEERHKIVHALWGLKAVSIGVGAYFGYHARTQTEVAAEPEIINEAASRLEACATQGFELFFRWGPRVRPSDSQH
jgi:hypothetical protein